LRPQHSEQVIDGHPDKWTRDHWPGGADDHEEHHEDGLFHLSYPRLENRTDNLINGRGASEKKMR
jgi:hypothetical protein